jgi:hypothetical protein
MNAKNLLILADFLETVPAEGWNYARILTRWDGRKKLSCGTTACAIGWGTQVPELQAAGLHLNRIRMSADFHLLFKRAMKAFDLSKDEATHLFIPRSVDFDAGPLPESATAREVAAHIRAFVACGGLLEKIATP